MSSILNKKMPEYAKTLIAKYSKITLIKQQIEGVQKVKEVNNPKLLNELNVELNMARIEFAIATEKLLAKGVISF